MRRCAGTRTTRAVFLDGQRVDAHGTKTVAPTQTTTYALKITFADNTTQTLTTVLTVTPAGAAQIKSVTFSPTTLNTGGLLNVSTIVQNGTADPMPTQDPASGFVYEESDTFCSRGFTETNGAYRVGIDFDGRTGIDHPFRWGLGVPLAPGQSATITGAIRLKTTRAINYWAGLVRGKIAWVQDRQGTQKITVTAAPTLAFTVTPPTIAPGQSAKLEWNAVGARGVTLDGQVVDAQGSRVVTPTKTTTCTLHVVLSDGIARDLTATVTVSTQPQPMRPPTVTLTPENVTRLKTYPRPSNDNGRGLHFHIDLRDSTIAVVVPKLLSIGCKWTLIYVPDENQAKRAAKGCWDAGIMPTVRIGKRVDEFFDPVRYVTALKEIGAPAYVQIYNEPGDNREWKVWPG